MTRARIGIALAALASLSLVVLYLLPSGDSGTPVLRNIPIGVSRFQAAPVELADGRILVLSKSRSSSDAPATLDVIGRDSSINRVSVTAPTCSSSEIEDLSPSMDGVFLVLHCEDDATSWLVQYDIASNKLTRLQEVSKYESIALDGDRLVASARQYDIDYGRYVRPECPSLAVGTIGALQPIQPLAVIGDRPSWQVDKFFSGTCTQSGFIQDLDVHGSNVVVIAGSNPAETGGCSSDGINQLCALYWIDLRTSSLQLISKGFGYSSVLAVSDDTVVVAGDIAGKSGLWKFDRRGNGTQLYNGPVTPPSLTQDRTAVVVGIGGEDHSDVVSFDLQ